MGIYKLQLLNKIKKMASLYRWWTGSGTTTNTATASVANQLDTVEQLHTALNALKIRRARLIVDTDRQEREIRAKAQQLHQQGRREEAKKMLQKINAIKRPIADLDGQIQNIETLQQQMESTATTAHMVVAMKGAVVSMKQMVDEVDVEDVSELHGDLTDVVQQTNQLNGIFSKPLLVGGDHEYIDDPSDQMLDQWDLEDAAQQTAPLDSLAVPTHTIDESRRGNGAPPLELAEPKTIEK